MKKNFLYDLHPFDCHFIVFHTQITPDQMEAVAKMPISDK